MISELINLSKIGFSRSARRMQRTCCALGRSASLDEIGNQLKSAEQRGDQEQKHLLVTRGGAPKTGARITREDGRAQRGHGDDAGPEADQSDASRGIPFLRHFHVPAISEVRCPGVSSQCDPSAWRRTRALARPEITAVNA